MGIGNRGLEFCRGREMVLNSEYSTGKWEGTAKEQDRGW